MTITSKGANDKFAAYDFDITSDTFELNLFISHPDNDWDSNLQERMIFLNPRAFYLRGISWELTRIRRILNFTKMNFTMQILESLYLRLLLNHQF